MRMFVSKHLAFMAALAAASIGGTADALDVGHVDRAQGVCEGTSDGKTTSLSPGVPIAFEQILQTKAGARLELSFVDSTVLTLGENTEIRIDRFVYDPAGARRSVRLAAVGAFRFVSGVRGAPVASDVSVVTPVATIGVRGTDFWAGPIDGAYGVLLLDGAVEVVNGAGSVTLDEPGEGVNLVNSGTPPGAVTLWPRDKVGRALAAVAFQ